ncbi:MAG TPA: hypothetical protein PLX89_22310 [Verrucomicrobiota bacterium]|nr:hypothetical protein [Verrucomicrobiota bacterium]
MFTDDEVKAVLANEGGDASKLTSRQRSMLQLPQNLSLFVDAGLARSENRFNTPKELCDACWTTKRKAVAAQRLEFDAHWQPAIKLLAAALSARQELSAPASVMDAFPPEFLERMASEGVLTWDGHRYGFGHETFFDYCFARTQPNGGRDFIRFLESDAQQLFRRAQLRQVLAFLRDDDFAVYCEGVGYLLRSGRIRPHLKLLTIELLTALPEPKDEELKMLLPWIESEMARWRANQTNPDHLASRIWESFFHSCSMFVVADRLGLIQQWLNSAETSLAETMCLYLRRQTDWHAERIAELLEPFVGRGGEWRKRLRYMMEGPNLSKSRRYFELFLRLFDNGTLDDAKDQFVSNGTFWSMLHGFAEERPVWCAELAAHWLDRRLLVAQASAEQLERPWSLFDDQAGVEELGVSARSEPAAFLQFVIPAILRVAETARYVKDPDTFSRDRVWHVPSAGEYPSLSQAFLRASKTALALVGAQSPKELRPLIARLRAAKLYIANYLLLYAYLSNPVVFADEALQLLAQESLRLSCGYSDSPYWTSRQVIEACSPHCADSTFRGLEAALLEFVPAYERTRDGIRSRGRAAYNLASALPVARTSNRAKAQLAEWSGKFKAPDSPPRGVHSCEVVSPIKRDSALHMTDDQWLRAIAKYNSADRRRDFNHPERGGAQHLAGMLQQFVKEQPERFARLSLRFPEDTDPSYFTNVLYGLKEAEIAGPISWT